MKFKKYFKYKEINIKNNMDYLNYLPISLGHEAELAVSPLYFKTDGNSVGPVIEPN